METILANAVSKPRRVKHRGREWLVTSASLIVPGVLKGSQGALYYPPDEIAANHWAWNGMPIVVGHPLKDGIHVSARDPDILERFGIGHVYRANANGKLAAEAWFDVADVRNYDKRENTHILSDLEAGKVVELSTGLETHNHPTEGTYNGVAYTHIARNYRPDHLALLLGEKGACSASDGCGFNVNADNEPDLVDAVDSLLETLVNAGVYGNPQSKNTGKFKKLGAGTGKGDIHESAQRGHVVITDKQRELGAEAKTQADAGQNPPSWAVDEPTWERAKAAADKGEYGEDSYYAVVTHIYEKMGGTIQGKTENAEGEGFESDEQRRAFFGLKTADSESSKDSGASQGSVKRQYDLEHGEGKYESRKKEFTSAGGSEKEFHEMTTKLYGHAAKGLEEQSRKASKEEAAKKADDELQSTSKDISNLKAGRVTHLQGHKIKKDKMGFLSVDGGSPQPQGTVMRMLTEKIDKKHRITGNQEDQPMTREQKIQNLTTNCDCWKGKTTTLNKLDDKELDELLANVQKEAKERKAQQTVVNQLKEGVSLGGTAVRLTLNASGNLIVRNAEGDEEMECAPDDVECLEMMAAKKKPSKVQLDPVEDDAVVVKNRRKPTLKEWEDSMPSEAREVWNAAKETERNERKKLVGVLVGNIRDDGQRQAKAKKLMTRSTADLREQVELVQAAIAANVQTRDTVTGNAHDDLSFNYQPTLYAGDGPTPNGYQLTDNEANDVLPDPSDTYAASGYNDPTINAGEGVVRHFRPERRTRTRQQRQEAEVEEIA